MTQKHAAAQLRALGMTLRKEEGEYRVNFRGGSEATAYYTNDLEDAVYTAADMAARAAR